MTATQDSRRSEYAYLVSLFTQLADPALPPSEQARVRDRLITGYLPIAHHIAQRFRGRGQPDDDLRQVAVLGLINAVDRFDSSRGSDFLAFAVPTISGEIRRHFRDATWATRVPRRIKELHAAISAATTHLSHQLGRAPKPSELAAELNVPVEQIHEGIQGGLAYQSGSLDRDHDDVGHPITAALGAIDTEFETVEDREMLLPALAALPERQATIVFLRFFGNLTQTQIAQRIGISQMHVSRLLTADIDLRVVPSWTPPEVREGTREVPDHEVGRCVVWPPAARRWLCPFLLLPSRR